MLRRTRHKAAFSLVELSIVLVILGLLTGGILAGQSLIHAAELRSVSNDYSKYLTAVGSFRDKYFGIPGDLKNATSFWNSLGGNGGDVDCAYTTPSGNATCNGDGDGSLKDYQAFIGYNSQETFRFWQHLANAGLVEGQYTGFPGTATIGTTVPGSRIGGGAYFIARAFTSNGMFTTTPYEFGGNYGKNIFMLTNGGSGATAGSMVLKPEDAWNIDTKLDDGVPGTGRIWSYKGQGAGKTICTSNANSMTDAGATYALTTTTKDCQLYFINAF